MSACLSECYKRGKTSSVSVLSCLVLNFTSSGSSKETNLSEPLVSKTPKRSWSIFTMDTVLAMETRSSKTICLASWNPFCVIVNYTRWLFAHSTVSSPPSLQDVIATTLSGRVSSVSVVWLLKLKSQTTLALWMASRKLFYIRCPFSKEGIGSSIIWFRWVSTITPWCL